MSQPTRFALIGCGAVATRHAEQAIRHWKLVACCDIIFERAQHLAAQFGGLSFNAIETLFAEEKEVDVVCICTSNGLHARHMIQVQEITNITFSRWLKHSKTNGILKWMAIQSFKVFCPAQIPDLPSFVETFRSLAIQNGLPGIYLVGGQKTPVDWNSLQHGFDAVMSDSFGQALKESKPRSSQILDMLWGNKISCKLFAKGKSLNHVTYYEYLTIIKSMKATHNKDGAKQFPVFPVVVNDWDNTPRAGKKGITFKHVSSNLYVTHVDYAIRSLKERPVNEKIIFIKSWNELAEGNYLEPDSKYGSDYFRALKQALSLNESI